jgi:hypothetical protein
VRNIRVRADENIPPAIPIQKTIHHRNKSSPTLSSVLGAAGLKAPAKRTAFGDVSNTANATRPAKDDSVVALKQGVLVSEKAVSVLADKKPTTFLRQATRPYSVSNLRGLLTGAGGSTSTDIVQKPAPIESNNLPNSRKTLTKRPATTIFKDVTLPALQEAAAKSASESQSIDPSFPLNKPSSTLPEVVPTEKPVDVLQAQTIPASDTTIEDGDKSSIPAHMTSSEGEESAALRSDGIYIDDKGNVQIYKEVQGEPQYESQIIFPMSKPTGTTLPKSEQSQIPKATAPQPTYAAAAASIQSTQPPVSYEAEEYWEEEEDDNYEEEGYVTARSFRSRGDNTTGGATTVLFPQVNQKVKREIEAAKQLVEAERTPEEIEDECFDTSMVAEYGDEIFDYMRELEVSQFRDVLSLRR